MTGISGRQGLYADPMVYDILYTPGTAAEVDALERIERFLAPEAGHLPHRRWLEPACGTGRYLRTAAGRGRRCLGFDLDPGQISYAQKRQTKSGSISYHLADMANFVADCQLPRHGIDFAFNPVNSLRHLADDSQMLGHFRDMALVLKPGALYVVGISLTDYTWLQPEEDLWEARRGKCRVSQLVNYLPPEPGTPRSRSETVLSHLTVTRPSGVEHFDDRYDLRSYDQKQWRQLVAASALDHAGSFDCRGRILESRQLPYQLEALRNPGC